ncbi:MAG: hypothetical protein OSA47_10020, partial [Novosphingopyxis baekryungensis]|nr:hypothetical protein [Novosphingopyxis baekryungensis]
PSHSFRSSQSSRKSGFKVRYDAALLPPSAAAAEHPDPAQPQLRAGQWVRVEGLTAREDLNGRDVHLREWIEEAGRWAVCVLGSAECVRIRPRNLVPSQDDEERRAIENGAAATFAAFEQALDHVLAGVPA